MPQENASAAALISGAVKAAGERASGRAEDRDANAAMDDDSMILSESDAIEYAQPYNKC